MAVSRAEKERELQDLATAFKSAETEALQGGLEDARVGLFRTEFLRDDQYVEQLLNAEGAQLTLLSLRPAVGHDGQAEACGAQREQRFSAVRASDGTKRKVQIPMALDLGRLRQG